MTIIKSDINSMLKSLLGDDELVERWWVSPNKAFDMETPNVVYQSGVDGQKQVYDYVYQFIWGKL